MKTLYTPYAYTISDFSSGPPSSPSTGDIWVATNIDSNGSRWQFQYNSGSASAYKWEFIGGAPSYSAVETSETIAVTTYGDLATPGPSFTCARGGDYIITFSADMFNNTSGSGAVMSPSIAGATPSDTNALFQVVPGVTQANLNFGGKIAQITGITASGVIKMQYRAATSGTATFIYRRLLVTPVRIA